MAGNHRSWRLLVIKTTSMLRGEVWDQPWLNTIFPGNPRYPHKPDVVVNDFAEFWALVLACAGSPT